MKRLSLFLPCIFLLGCGLLSLDQETKPESDRRQTQSNDRLLVSAAALYAVQLEPEPDQYLSIADWLVQRQTACDLSNDAIDAHLERYRGSFSNAPDEGDPAQLVHAYSQLKALMLASCNPARTPGLLNNFLTAVRDYSHWPPEYKALFDLLASEQRAYALLEQKYRELEARHKKTIEGIGNIERTLEDQTEPRS